MKRYIYGNHPWLTKWVEDYHLANMLKNDIGGIEKLSWLMFIKIYNHKDNGHIYTKFRKHFKSYGIKVTKNKKKQLVFHIDKAMKVWISLHN